MSHTSGKISRWLFNKLFAGIAADNKKAIEEAIIEERTWSSGMSKGRSATFLESDPFYAKFPQRDTDYQFEILEGKYLKGDKKELFKKGSALREQLVKTIEATGWAPTGYEDAAFRIGSIDELSAIQDACFKKYMLDPLGKSIVMNMQYFTVGKGVKVGSVAEDVDAWLTEFRTYNRMGRREKRMVRSAYVEGEYFLAYVKDGNRVHLRKVAPSRVREINTKEDDIEQIDSYDVYKTDGTKGSEVKDVSADIRNNGEMSLFGEKALTGNKYIQFIRYGEEEYLRGQPPMYPILRYLRHYEDWVVDRMRLNHERAKVVWIRTRMGTTAATPDSPLIAPKGGIILEENPNITYRIESPKLDAGDAKEDGLAILYSIGAGINMPLHVLTQITSEQVYASIKKADSPFSQMIESNQDMWKEEWDFMYRFAMKLSGKFDGAKFKIPYYPDDSKTEAMKLINEMIVDKRPDAEIMKEAKKILDRKGGKKINATIDDVPISQVFPDVVNEDPLSIAKALFLHQKMKIVSNQTAAERAGYNWQEELSKMIAEVDVIPKDEKEVAADGKPKPKSKETPGLTDDEFGDDSLAGPQV